MRRQTLLVDRGHQSEQLLSRSFYLFRAYKKVVVLRSTKEVLKTNQESCSHFLFIVLNKYILEKIVSFVYTSCAEPATPVSHLALRVENDSFWGVKR